MLFILERNSFVFFHFTLNQYSNQFNLVTESFAKIVKVICPCKSGHFIWIFQSPYQNGYAWTRCYLLYKEIILVAKEEEEEAEQHKFWQHNTSACMLKTLCVTLFLHRYTQMKYTKQNVLLVVNKTKAKKIYVQKQQQHYWHKTCKKDMLSVFMCAHIFIEQWADRTTEHIHI